MKTLPTRFILTLILLVTGISASAQSGTWTNVDGPTGPGDGSGTWSTAANWQGGIVANGIDAIATFNLPITTNSIINLDSSRTIGNLVFGNTSSGGSTTTTTNWVLNNNTLTLQTSTGTPTITVNNGTNVINSTLAGNQGFSLAASGLVVLTGNSTALGGNINLNSGFVLSDNNTGSPLGAQIVNSTSTLSNIVTIASNTATLEMFPATALLLKPIFASGGGVGGTNGAIYANLGGIANHNSSTRVSIGLTSVATPAVTLLGNTTIRVDGTNFLAFGSDMLLGQTTTSNALTGVPENYTNFTLTKIGTGKLAIDPANGYTAGNIHVQQGGFEFDNNNGLANQTITVDSGTFLQMGNITSMNSTFLSLILNGLMDINGRGTGASNSDTTVAADVIGYLSGSGMITNGEEGNTGAGTLTISGTNGSTSTFSGTIVRDQDGSVGLKFQNTNSVQILTGANTYQGITAINAGTLLVDGSHIGGGAYTIGTNAVLGGSGIISSVTALTDNGGIIQAGDPSILGSSLAISNGIAVGTGSGGAIIISNANLSVEGTIGASGQSIGTLYMDNGTLTIPLPTSSTPAIFASAVNVDGNATLSYSVVTPVTGVFPLISYGSIGGLAGFSGLSLSSPSGITATLSNDTVNLQIDVVVTAIPALTWIGNVNSNWDIGVSANWAGNLTYTQPGGQGLFTIFNDVSTGFDNVNITTTVNPKGIIVNNNSKTYSFNGPGNITGSGSLLKEGTGSLTVINSGNSFSGGVTLQQGTLQIGNGGTSGDLGSTPIANTASLVLDKSGAYTLGNTVSGSGNITNLAGTATLPFSGNTAGAITVTSGTLLLDPTGTSTTISNGVAGSGAFGVNSAGTLIMDSSANTWSGGTVISNGTLQFGDGAGNGALPPAGNISDNGTMILTLSGTLGNNISGSGGVSMIDNTSMTYSGNKTYNGPTLVIGTLSATASAYPSTSALTLGDQLLGNGIGNVTFTSGNPVTGGLNIGGDSTTYNYLNFPAGNQVLTINGNVSFGFASPAGATTSGSITEFSGSGISVVVNTNGGIIQVGLGNTSSGVNSDNVQVDFSQIDNFTANLGTNNINSTTNSAFNLGTLDGNPGISGTAGAIPVELLLANISNSITAGTVTIGAGGRQNIPNLYLGPGTNIFNVGTFNVGTGGRDGGAMSFNTGSGGVLICGPAGPSTTANYNQGVNPTSATGAGFSTTVDFTGGTADLLLGSMVIGYEPDRVGQWTNTFTFYQGVLSAASLSLSQRSLSNVDYSVMNIDGGTVTLGPVILGNGPAGAVLNINGGTVTVNSMTYTNSGVNPSQKALNIQNATFNVSIQGFGNPATAPVSAADFSASGTVNLGVNGTGFTVGHFPFIRYTGSIGGSGFPALSLTSLPAMVTGSLSNDVANSSVDLVITSAPPAINPNPTNIIVSANGGNINLSWPADHTGWQLQVQTNSLSAGLRSNWVNVPNSTTEDSIAFPINLTNGTVFYRLAYQ